MSATPNYVKAILTEAQLAKVQDMVREKIATMDPGSEAFEDEVRLLGALLVPEKVSFAA